MKQLKINKTNVYYLLFSLDRESSQRDGNNAYQQLNTFVLLI